MISLAPVRYLSIDIGNMRSFFLSPYSGVLDARNRKKGHCSIVTLDLPRAKRYRLSARTTIIMHDIQNSLVKRKRA